jgi:predicted aconitase
VPYFRLPHLPPLHPHTLLLRTLGAAMAASGAVALYHVEGVTPEAQRAETLAPDAERVVIKDLSPAYAALNAPVEQIDLVSIGCPHASLDEIADVARAVEGRRLQAALWITTARQIKEQAAEAGHVAMIEAAGGQVVADTCLVVAPMDALGFRTMATNSAKMALYAPSHSGLQVRFGALEQCLDAALTGKWL